MTRDGVTTSDEAPYNQGDAANTLATALDDLAGYDASAANGVLTVRSTGTPFTLRVTVAMSGDSSVGGSRATRVLTLAQPYQANDEWNLTLSGTGVDYDADHGEGRTGRRCRRVRHRAARPRLHRRRER